MAKEVRTQFKTPEGRHRLVMEKMHPSGILNHNPQRTTKVSLARLKGKNGAADETYIIFNVGDSFLICDFNKPDRDPVKHFHLTNSVPTCHAYNNSGTDDQDLIIGFAYGEVVCVSLRQQLKENAKKLNGISYFNRDGSINATRCVSLAWVPKSDGHFAAAHADGYIYIYDKNKDGSSDVVFQPSKDNPSAVVSYAKSSKSNPLMRWHVSSSPINEIAFSYDGSMLATVGRDGYLRVFEYSRGFLLTGFKSYYGALLCCAWSSDGQYIFTGGEDDLVSVWSLQDRAVVAWAEGHNSWVSAVAFDPWWTAPSPAAGADPPETYRFGSVGQDTQLLLWDFSPDTVVLPRRLQPSPIKDSTAPLDPSPSDKAQPRNLSISQKVASTNTDSSASAAALSPIAPPVLRRDVPRIAPVMAHQVHQEPLSAVVFTPDSIITACQGGQAKVWQRPHPTPVREADDSEPHTPVHELEHL
eukprot:jgi/Chlat1/3857/Chrsp26S04156